MKVFLKKKNFNLTFFLRSFNKFFHPFLLNQQQGRSVRWGSQYWLHMKIAKSHLRILFLFSFLPMSLKIESTIS